MEMAMAMAMANTNNMIHILSFFLLFIFTQILTLSAFPTTTTSNDSDFLFLLDFKGRIQIDPSHCLDSWNNSLHFCDWHGITCGRKHNRVTALNFSSLELVGTLSPSIGNLTFLRKIQLGGNSFYGVIPPEIGSLFRLQSFVLSNNLFEGQIPVNISSCKNLLFIKLGGNKLSGRIPDQLGALPNLLELTLSTNNFTGTIPPSLGNISTLQTLSLSFSNLIGNIPHELGKLFNLQQLGLALNKLSGSFPRAIYNISSIEILSITSNNITGQFPDSLGLTLPKLTLIEIGGNNFSGSIPSTLANASDLEIIDFGGNKLTGPIPRNLGRLQYLQKLLFDNNPLGFDRDNDISIISTFTNCTNLTTLVLGGIEMGGVLPLEISNLSRKLTIFGLNDNYISGNLPEGIGELVGLNEFSVSTNILSGNIPLSIGKLINMKQLYLGKNKFEGEIPPSIGDISGLLTLVLGQNMLTGSIPHSLSNLTKLLELDLSQNRLNGIVPPEIGNMTSLSNGLYFEYNKFTGPLPFEIGNLRQLVVLNIAGNEISGEIPISIGGCVMLNGLDFHSNFINGTIPSSIGQLKNIDLMYLSRNNLSGKIPTSLENLTFIRFLDLSFNMLEGEVPKNGVFAKASTFSIAGNERLCGGIKSLKLHECPTKDSKKHGKLSTHIIIILVICFLISLVSFFGVAYTIYQKRKSRRVPTSTSPYEKKLLKISYAVILKSTNSFSSENLIGEGKYGFVYRGVLNPGEKLIAVKVLKLQLKGAHKSFMAECEVLRNIRHRNLVKIITSCSSIDFKGNDFKALIMEYVSNGSLEEWLHLNPSDLVNDKKLDLLQRLNIAIDIAMALDYLHNHSGNPVVHCDIKPSNILLGDDLRGLVSDFGLAKFLPTVNNISRDIESTSIGIRGTIGYIAPEYGMGGDESAKGDIYSYGILLLEMFTGKRPTDAMFTENFNLRNYVKDALDHRMAKIIDQKLLTDDNEGNKGDNTLRKNIIEACCLSIFRVGVSCSSEMKNERMDIDDALTELQHIRNKMQNHLNTEFVS